MFIYVYIWEGSYIPRTASFAYNILPTASFAYIPNFLQTIIAHIQKLKYKYTLHTWHYCAHTHCTYDIIAHEVKKSFIEIYTLYTGYYYAHTDCTYTLYI